MKAVKQDAALQSYFAEASSWDTDRLMQHNRDEVYRLHGWVGQKIHLEFEAGESFVALSGGDLDALTLGSERNSLTGSPAAETRHRP